MRSRPGIGEEAIHRVTVTPEMTARLFDREIHPVYGTAWMVRHIEEAGRSLIEPSLAADEDATGYSINLAHERPAAIGDQLTITARVTEVDERQCTVQVEVAGPKGVVGRAAFVQRYIARDRMEGVSYGLPAGQGRPRRGGGNGTDEQPGQAERPVGGDVG